MRAVVESVRSRGTTETGCNLADLLYARSLSLPFSDARFRGTCREGTARIANLNNTIQ